MLVGETETVRHERRTDKRRPVDVDVARLRLAKAMPETKKVYGARGRDTASGGKKDPSFRLCFQLTGGDAAMGRCPSELRE